MDCCFIYDHVIISLSWYETHRAQMMDPSKANIGSTLCQMWPIAVVALGVAIFVQNFLIISTVQHQQGSRTTAGTGYQGSVAQISEQNVSLRQAHCWQLRRVLILLEPLSGWAGRLASARQLGICKKRILTLWTRWRCFQVTGGRLLLTFQR